MPTIVSRMDEPDALDQCLLLDVRVLAHYGSVKIWAFQQPSPVGYVGDVLRAEADDLCSRPLSICYLWPWIGSSGLGSISTSGWDAQLLRGRQT